MKIFYKTLRKIKKISKTEKISEHYKVKLQSVIDSLQYLRNFLPLEKIDQIDRNSVKIYCEESLKSCCNKIKCWEPKVESLDSKLKAYINKMQKHIF